MTTKSNAISHLDDVASSPSLGSPPNNKGCHNSHIKGDTEDSDAEPDEAQISQFKEDFKREGLMLDLAKYNLVTPSVDLDPNNTAKAQPQSQLSQPSQPSQPLSWGEDMNGKISDILDFLGK
eukprot:Phypoly_transcript_12540.p2 GENE.Phypoly_transcript_12540~~Phypoly_transcript_12540.p2  ORF type:complete len:122 (-),score=19.49 Phypoly_transcript_12540:753-1118(-)